jgi:deoxyribodipyrimidine photo-lyase
MIHPARINALNRKDAAGGEYVLYWMQASQRESMNHALELAAEKANEHGVPLLAYFGLTDQYPEANWRHYRFMLEGLAEVQKDLAKRGIRLIVRRERPDKGVLELGKRAVLVVTDCGYTRVQRAWREGAASRLACRMLEVESDVSVPLREASSKEEYSAATIRPRIKRRLEEFLRPLERTEVVKDSLGFSEASLDLSDLEKIEDSLALDRRIPPVAHYTGGSSKAAALLEDFAARKLDAYGDQSRDPTMDGLSNLSPYLHFGQISPLKIALRIKRRRSPGEEPFLEELIIRRELSMNFVAFNPHHDRLSCLPSWASATLEEHRQDPREYIYDREEFESAATHDPYWNAAQKEMVLTGKMHGYMRMYWGKKILEWSRTPGEAYETALYLNNRYELDGRDPNGFTGVAWCFGKHDRAWTERPVFGKVRYMNAKGLRRKFDADAYVNKVEALSGKDPAETG